MENKYLMHYGVLGMKWGKRKGETTVNSRAIKNIGKIASSGSQVTRDLQNITSNTSNQTKVKNKTIKSIEDMSDEDLKKVVNRMNLENNYANLSSQRVTSGREKVEKTLSVAGNVLAIGASVAGIAVAIHQLKGGK